VKGRLISGFYLFVLLLLVEASDGCGDFRDGHEHGEHEHEHGDHKEEFERGPHHGRLLTDGTFSAELQIFETGTSPHYRLYGYENGRLIAPKELTAEVELGRLGGRTENFTLHPVDDFLTSDLEVSEPHSFDVEVNVSFRNKRHSWSFASYEGRTVIPDEVARISGVTTKLVSDRVLRRVLRVRGKVQPSEHRIAHIIPRFSGIVREGRKHIGDPVEKGEVLAIIESNQNLQTFEVRSQINGTVINGHLIIGEFVPENQWVYVVADLSEVWVDYFVPLRKRAEVARGQKVLISSADELNSVAGVVSYVAPYADEKSQSQLVRVVVKNPHGEFLPGMFVTGDIVTEEVERPAIKASALQTFRDWQVVFLKIGDTYEVRPVTLGRRDGEWIEVKDGVSLNDEYVTENSFLIKGDILKAGASHDH
jgi:cobalt-zinc-cadmium efflux system membrane fusion protein